ncbi:MAG: GNAT family N-acetyltransferase [Clostridiales bacterium]|nr:GNAT family N-acetyltransferase [Clostridiales bacterium]
MIRKAVREDILKIAETYTELLTYEEKQGGASNWKIVVYPTVSVPEKTVPEGTMYVLEEDGKICGSMILNRFQAPEYFEIEWKYTAPEDKVFVIHTLCIPPKKSGKGFGTQMIEYAKRAGERAGCEVIRIDTYVHNEPAKNLYQKKRFQNCRLPYGKSCRSY